MAKVKVDIVADLTDLEKAKQRARELGVFVNDLGATLGHFATDLSYMSEEQLKATSDLIEQYGKEQKEKFDELIEKFQAGPVEGKEGEFNSIITQMEQAGNLMNQLGESSQRVQNEMEKFAPSIAHLWDQVEKVNKSSQVFGMLVNSVKSKIENVKKSAEKMANTMKRWTVRAAFMGALRMVRQGIQAAIQSSEELSNQQTAHASVLAASFVPVVERIMGLFRRLYVVVAGVLNALFGFNPIQKAIDNTSKKIKKVGTSGKKAAKDLKGLTSNLDEITNIEPQSSSGGMGGLGADLDKDMGGLIELQKMLDEMNKMDFSWVQTIKDNMPLIIIGLGGLAAAFIAVKIAGLLAAVGTTAALWPVLTVIAAVTLLAMGVYLVIKHWDKIKEFFGKIGEKIKEVISNGWNKIKEFGSKLWEGIKKIPGWIWDMVKKIGQFFIDAWVWYISLWIDGIMFIIDGIIGFYNKAKEWFSKLWTKIKDIFKNIGSWFGDRVSDIIEAFKKLPTKIYNFFKTLWDRIVGLFKKIGTAVGDGIGGAVRKALNGVIGGAVKIINGFLKGINLAIGLINKIPGVKITKLKMMDVPSFDVGTPYVPRDMYAQIHKGERIVPAKYNHDDYGKVDMSETNNLLYELISAVNNQNLTLDGKKITQTVINNIKNDSRRMGVSVL